MPTKDKTPVFEPFPPRIDLCGLCEHPFELNEEVIYEERATGRGGKLQTWAYHVECKAKMVPLRTEGFINILRNYEGAPKFNHGYIVNLPSRMWRSITSRISQGNYAALQKDAFFIEQRKRYRRATI